LSSSLIGNVVANPEFDEPDVSSAVNSWRYITPVGWQHAPTYLQLQLPDSLAVAGGTASFVNFESDFSQPLWGDRNYCLLNPSMLSGSFQGWFRFSNWNDAQYAGATQVYTFSEQPSTKNPVSLVVAALGLDNTCGLTGADFLNDFDELLPDDFPELINATYNVTNVVHHPLRFFYRTVTSEQVSSYSLTNSNPSVPRKLVFGLMMLLPTEALVLKLRNLYFRGNIVVADVNSIAWHYNGEVPSTKQFLVLQVAAGVTQSLTGLVAGNVYKLSLLVATRVWGANNLIVSIGDEHVLTVPSQFGRPWARMSGNFVSRSETAVLQLQATSPPLRNANVVQPQMWYSHGVNACIPESLPAAEEPQSQTLRQNFRSPASKVSRIVTAR
jgi:hypothetical protein